MKKLIYTGAFAALALGFVACSEAEEEIADAMDETEISDTEAVSEEKVEELNETLDTQGDAEALDEELSEFIETL